MCCRDIVVCDNVLRQLCGNSTTSPYLLVISCYVLACGNLHLLCYCCCCERVSYMGCSVLHFARVCTCRCDERADVFSLGVVLWELITQEPPRRGMLRDIMVSIPLHLIAVALLLHCLCSLFEHISCYQHQPPRPLPACLRTSCGSAMMSRAMTHSSQMYDL